MALLGAPRLPRVAIVGRQNVGKSTLANRLAGKRAAIAHETPGVTRDRIEIEAAWRGRSFVLVDTGGYAGWPRGVEQSVAAQAERATEDADVVVLVVDSSTGVQEEDAVLAGRLRRIAAPVIVVANKVDGPGGEPEAARFYSLGLGEPYAVSALHGRGSGELLDLIVETMPGGPEAELESEARFAIVGRPNVGKSSLFNRLVRDERAVVHDQPGTTRDAIDSIVEAEGIRVRFVDTAGFRRMIKTEGVEYFGLVRSMQAVSRSDVALLVVDSSECMTGEDKRIAARVFEAGRGLVVTLNKWDLVPSGERADLFVRLTAELALYPGVPVLRTSATSGMGVGRILAVLLRVREAWGARVPTAEVNRVLQKVVSSHPAPRGAGRIRYGTQTGAGPPMFVLFGATDPPATYRRYVEGALRDAFGFGGVPLRVRFKPKAVSGGERRGASGRSRSKGG